MRKGSKTRLKAFEEAAKEEAERAKTEIEIASAIEKGDEDFVSLYMRPRYDTYFIFGFVMADTYASIVGQTLEHKTHQN